MESKIIEILKELGIPMGILGFKYIKEAVIIAAGNDDALSGITKSGGIYDTVAKKNNSTKTRVERAIRHAIEQCFIRPNTKVIEKYFGNTPDISSGKLTNRNFIAALVDVVNSSDRESFNVEQLIACNVACNKPLTECSNQELWEELNRRYNR